MAQWPVRCKPVWVCIQVIYTRVMTVNDGGDSPVSPSPSIGAISTLFGPTLPNDGVDPIVDEFACLNLNITAPLQARELGTVLPVAVFIHG
jgi:hypothetical protein